MNRCKVLTLLFLLAVTFASLAQPQANNWFFCRNNGISFSSGSAVNIPSGQVTNMEGASAISNSNGQLLFYTDGYTVWNRNHAMMQNGVGLLGGSFSSTQAALIIPKTYDEKEYYIFTVDQEGGIPGLNYNIVDMTMAGGLGAITTKNVQLVPRTCEKLTAVRHCNKKDFWIIVHKYGTDEYFAFLATSSGVNPTPVISRTGALVPNSHAVMAGQLRASPDGKLLAAATPTIGIELSDFNNQTGVVSNTREIFGNNNGNHYGVEFSANASYLYAGVTGYWDDVDWARFGGVFQFDVTQPSTAAIRNSKVQFVKIPMPSQLGFLQRGPDGKIYMAQYMKNYLSVIHSPNLPGTAATYVDQGFPLTHVNEFSLPNMIGDYGFAGDSISSSNGTCINIPANFHFSQTANVTSVLWDFGDPASGAGNASSSYTTSHTYTTGGSYPVTVIKYGLCGNDTLRKNIVVGDVNVNLGIDTSICDKATITLDPRSPGNNTYLWQDNSTAPALLASTAGLYWVQVMGNSNGCTKRDTINIGIKPLPIVNLGKDSTICLGQSLQLDAGNSGSTFQWQDNSTAQMITVSQAANYWVKVTTNGCSNADTIKVSTIDKPDFSLGPDQFLCPGLTVSLTPNLINPSHHYLWQDGSTGTSFIANAPGDYHLQITNVCGARSDTLIVSEGGCTLMLPSAFTPNNDGLNDLFRAVGTQLVKDFSLIIFDRAGQLVFRTTDKNKGWDGKFKGKDLASAVYVYLLRYTETGSTETRLLKGVVTLLR